MALLSRFIRKSSKTVVSNKRAFPLVLKEKTRAGDAAYAKWVENHRWTLQNELWCRRQIEKFSYRPTIGILIQSKNPNAHFLSETLSSVFHQIYSFHELFIVDRGSEHPEVRLLLEQAAEDPRVKVSFQKGIQRDAEAIARIMKKASSEWLLLIGAEDILEPYTIYNMVAVLQRNLDADFVYSDSDLIDEEGLRFDPQFKPQWAVGAHYPLGYYQHPVLLHERLVTKLRGYERVSSLMEEGVLLDEASNHSRWVVRAAGILYHARARGLKNETPPAAVANVLMNENYVAIDRAIRIDPEIRIRSEPRIPLRLLWMVDLLEREDASTFLLNLGHYLAKDFGYHIHVVSHSDGQLRPFYQKFGSVDVIANDADLGIRLPDLHRQNSFDLVFATSSRNSRDPEIIRVLQLPVVFLIDARNALKTNAQTIFQIAQTVLFFSHEISAGYKSFDHKNISRILRPAAELAQIKLYKQRTSPIELRKNLNLARTSFVISILDPTIESKNQRMFVEAALQLLEQHPDEDVEFFIVGERIGNYWNEIADLIQGSNRKARFHIVPEEPDPSERYPYFWTSDLCVSCSNDESFPLSILEAMAFKKPVIAVRNKWTEEIIEDAGNGFLVPSKDVNSLCEKFVELSKNRDLAEAFGRRSLEIAMEKFTMQKSAHSFENYLRESIVCE